MFSYSIKDFKHSERSVRFLFFFLLGTNLSFLMSTLFIVIAYKPISVSECYLNCAFGGENIPLWTIC